MPKKLDLLFVPVLINNKENELIYFEENPIYNNWRNYKKKYHLLNYILPNEDIEDTQIFNKSKLFGKAGKIFCDSKYL